MDKETRRKQRLLSLAQKGGTDKDLVILDEIHAIEDKLEEKFTETSKMVDKLSDPLRGVDMVKIKGPKGDKGEPGKDGKDGKDGIDGKIVKGFDGKDGKDGRNGVDGKDGKDGKNGLDGKDGADGKDGKDGKDAEFPKGFEDKIKLVEKIPDIERIARAGAERTYTGVSETRVKELISATPSSGTSLPSQTGNSGKFLTTNGTAASWGTPTGSGDVVGPASAVNNNLAQFDGTTGKLLEDSGANLSQYAALASSPTFQEGSGQHTWFTVKAPSGDPQEATLTTMLDSGGGNKEFVDWTIENYGTDHIASINVAKAGTGTLLPLSVRFWNQDLGDIATNGVKTTTWLPTGEVGIGIAVPTEILHISKPTGNFTTIRYDSGTTQGYFFSYDGDNSVNIGSNSNSTVNFRVNNSTKATLNSSGNFNATGTVTGSNLSGTNTGDQTTVSGNAGTATALANARTIGGVSFNGTANITVASATGGFTVSGGDLALGTNNITLTGSIGATGARATKVWATDMQVTNAIAGSVTGSAATLTTARSIYGNNFDGSAALGQVIASTFGGTGNGFTKFTGPTTSEKTKTVRDATDTILELGGSYTPSGTWTSLTMVTPVLGTPTSGTLTNCTGLPVAGIVASTSTALGVGSIELGHASANTLTASGGVLSIEGKTVATLGTAQTWSATQTTTQQNYTVNAITASANAATVPITHRIHNVTNNSAATLTITLTTTSAVDGQLCQVRVYDFSGVAQTITWVNTENGESTVPATSNGSTTLPRATLLQFNGATSKWRCIAS